MKSFFKSVLRFFLTPFEVYAKARFEKELLELVRWRLMTREYAKWFVTVPEVKLVLDNLIVEAMGRSGAAAYAPELVKTTVDDIELADISTLRSTVEAAIKAEREAAKEAYRQKTFRDVLGEELMDENLSPLDRLLLVAKSLDEDTTFNDFFKNNQQDDLFGDEKSEETPTKTLKEVIKPMSDRAAQIIDGHIKAGTTPTVAEEAELHNILHQAMNIAKDRFKI